MPVDSSVALDTGAPEVRAAPRAARLAEVELLGVSLHALSHDECVRHVMTELAHGRGGWIVTPNLDHLRRLLRERSFRELCERATLRVADGMPLVWACRLQGTPLPGRVAGSDLIFTVTRAAALEARRVYFLGGDPGTAEEAARILAARFQGLQVAGVHCPPRGFERDAAALDELARELERVRAEVVLVALGSPKQELVIDALRERLPRAWWLGIGISFSFVCGNVKRAPVWMQRAGLEWLHRLAQEPRRLARRYLVDGLPFAAELVARAAWRRVFGRGSPGARADARDRARAHAATDARATDAHEVSDVDATAHDAARVSDGWQSDRAEPRRRSA